MIHALTARLLRLRRRLVSDERRLGWMPFFFLGYLAFLFLPMLFPDFDGGASRSGTFEILGPTLVSIAVFLPLYFLAYRSSGRQSIAYMLAIASLAFLLLPFNAFANTYLIYAIAFAAFMNFGMAYRLAWATAILSAFLIEILMLRLPVFVFAITAFVSIAVFFANHFQIENARKHLALERSHDEVRRLAALAERERIGRDLHDLLGHTLSLIALKSELAGKLLDRDAAAAKREIEEVTRVARDSLSQVRRAVTGIRCAGLGAELEAARQLLDSDGIRLACSLGNVALQTEQETVLALVVREAVTNIQRHARAANAEVILEARGDRICLHVRDDGRGGDIVTGNGLLGMRERVESCGGRMRVDSEAGEGTHLSIDLPVATQASSPTIASDSHPVEQQ